MKRCFPPLACYGRLASNRNRIVDEDFSEIYKFNVIIITRIFLGFNTISVLAINDDTTRRADEQSGDMSELLLLFPAFQSRLKVTCASKRVIEKLI